MDALSNNERDFILQIAVDGSSVTLVLGDTRVFVVVSAALEGPLGERSQEGSVRFKVSQRFVARGEGGRPRAGDDAELALVRLLERVFRDSRAIDQEALCVVAGHKVWNLVVDAHVLEDGGNVAGALLLCTLAALMAFRRPDTRTTTGMDSERSRVEVLPTAEFEPLPLSLHLLPVPHTFALFGAGDLAAADPCRQEEAAAGGLLTVVCSPQGDVTTLEKPPGLPLTLEQILALVRRASATAAETLEGVREALRLHDAARIAARVRRRKVMASPAAPDSRFCVTLSGAALDAAGPALKEEGPGIDMQVAG